MPKRTNDFQRLIYLIHHQLMGEATVTESKFLYDSAADTNREVDIVIELQAGEYPVIIGVECQGRGRVASVEWVEQMAMKHETLPTNKLILVSQSGFTTAARNKARACGIEAMTLNKAIRANWKGLVGLAALLLEKWSIETTACFALFPQPDGKTSTLKLDFTQEMYDEEEHDLLTVKETIDVMMDIYYEEVVNQLRDPAGNDQKPYVVFQLEFRLPENTYFMDTTGIKRQIGKLLLIGRALRERELVNLQNGSFGSAQVAFGKTLSVDAESLVSIVEYEDKANTAAIMLPTENKEMVRIVNLREAKTKLLENVPYFFLLSQSPTM